MAVLSLPVGYNAIPVFEDRPSVDPTINTVCRMIPTDIDNNMFQLIVADLDRCGVRKCRQANGETWLCLTLRFPLVSGLKLPEDELILIRCRPQDKMAQNTHAITVSTAKYAAKGAPINQPSPPSVFDGGQQDFRCEIGLFRKLPGTEIFAARVTNEVELDLGEEVQLRSIVRDGDGWQYSRLTTVIIQKVNAPKQRSILSATDLVFADGCRNPSYRVIARNHPKRDPRNPLINNFTFRVFMFQDMDIDEDLMITANIIGCVDAQDCAPTQCDGADEQDRLGYGKKKKRSVGKVGQFTFTTIIPASSRSASSSIPPYPPGTDIPSSIPPFPPPVSPPYSSIAPSVPLSKSNTHDNATTHWARNLRLKVKVPNSDITQKPIEAHECRLYLFITLGVAAVFCIASIIFVVVTLFRARSKPKKVPSPITVTHVQRHPNGSPSFMKPPSSSSASTCSSSLLSSEDSLLRCSNNNSPLRDFSVPPTVRQRKKEVNAELMNVFESERLFPYGTYCPGMLNYYGYMVVPRKAPYESSNEKRSLRAIKRDHKKHRIERVVETCQPVNESKNLESPQRFCQCRDSSDDFANFQDQNHKSVIHIPSSPSNLSSTVMSQCPKPLPRMRKDTEDENIYSEISLESNPTMV
ncbi:hypothetical protein SK128_018387 [Halocaridina rubra]|uniref:ZP domain-containing protein n=1 Tax=Halocaridina rubra TaxID=373956 RepID=A0AAN9A033_HALRR